jgi:hypothetical protein
MKPVYASEEDEVYDRVEKAWQALTVQKLVRDACFDEENAGLLFYRVTLLQSIETPNMTVPRGTYDSTTAVGGGKLSFDGIDVQVKEIQNEKHRHLWCDLYQHLNEYSRISI